VRDADDERDDELVNDESEFCRFRLDEGVEIGGGSGVGDKPKAENAEADSRCSILSAAASMELLF
jgi:hypothetical protein